MQTSGFTAAPLSRLLVIWTVLGAILVTLLDFKFFLYIQVVPHFWVYWQWWRIFTWQIAYTNSMEVLFAAMTIYHLRILERMWGTRKFASFLFTTYIWNTLLPPVILALVLRPLSFNHLNYLPAGPTPLIFSLLAQYHAAIPSTYRYKIGTTATPTSSSALNSITLTFTSKTTSYIIPAQIALAQFPGSVLSAAVGWVVGYAWRNEVLPYSTWRLPGWVVGEKSADRMGRRGSAAFEGMRRRLEGEASASGADAGRGDEGRRRTFGGLLAEQFGGR